MFTDYANATAIKGYVLDQMATTLSDTYTTELDNIQEMFDESPKKGFLFKYIDATEATEAFNTLLTVALDFPPYSDNEDDSISEARDNLEYMMFNQSWRE